MEFKLYSPPFNSKSDTPCKDKDIKSKHLIMKEAQNYVHILDRKVPPRALAVLPVVLQIRNDVISPRRPLPAHVRFGPVQGINNIIGNEEEYRLMNQSLTSQKPIFLCSRHNNSVTHIDTTDKDKSNWIGLLPLGNDATANVWLHEEDNALYGYTLKSIPAKTPLVLGYSKEYANKHGIPLTYLPLSVCEDIPSSSPRWSCQECHRTMATAALLQHHIDVHHKEEKPLSRRRYRCKQCTKTFSRLFTLKRHITHHCFKKTVKSKKQVQESETITAPDTSTINYTFNTDESKIPSDESFNNYTNSIDFNNLFDTDRIPNLDISGVSSCEDDFNPYSVINKDEGCLSNVLDYTKFSSDSDTLCQYEEVKDTVEEVDNLIPCPSCNQTIERENKRNHVRVCPGLKFYCKCGRVFTSSQKLENHMNYEHHNCDDVNMVPIDSTKIQYKCDECHVNFKRRGMLVNHMWRVHKTSSVSVPLEKRVRHYPCVACSKIYRTASKRDRHIKTHHPDAETSTRRSVDGGLIACRPAVCSACPRQYATRAKLLQHIRANHPDLAPPIKKSSTSNPNEDQNSELS